MEDEFAEIDRAMAVADLNEAEGGLDEEMKRSLFDDLRQGNERVSVAQFMEWDELEDMFERGIFTTATVDLILTELEIDRSLGFDYSQLIDTITLVNELAQLLDPEEDSGSEEASQLALELDEESDEEIQSQAYEWLFSAMQGSESGGNEGGTE
jgi:hypothetical protein